MTDEMMNFRALVEKAASCVAAIIAVGSIRRDAARFWHEIVPSKAETF